MNLRAIEKKKNQKNQDNTKNHRPIFGIGAGKGSQRYGDGRTEDRACKRKPPAQQTHDKNLQRQHPEKQVREHRVFQHNK